MIGFALSLVAFAILAFALIDVIRSEPWRIVYLDKVAWVFIVILIPVLGTILWFTIGKERAGASPRTPETAPMPDFDDDVDLDAAVEREIEFHENEARIRRLEAEIKAKRDAENTD